MTYDVLIIGAGPAGQEAGLFLGRAGLKTAVIGIPEKSDLGYGKMIENYFGVTQSPTGVSLLTHGVEHLKRCGVEVVREEAVDLQKTSNGFSIKTDKLNAFESKTVIIATGRQLPSAGIKGEKDFMGKGVHTCVACDGPLFKNKRVVVVGNGAHAAEEAIELRAYTDRVSMYAQGKTWEMDPNVLKLLKQQGIILEEKKIAAVEGAPLVEKIILKDGTVEPMDGVFLAMGSAGGITFAYKLGLEQENGFIAITRDGKTNVEGAWAAGACTGGNPQIAKSVGEGCNAAISIIRTLKGIAEYKDQT